MIGIYAYIVIEIDIEAEDHGRILDGILKNHPHVSAWAQVGETRWVDSPDRSESFQQFVYVPTLGDIDAWGIALDRAQAKQLPYHNDGNTQLGLN